MEVLAVACNGLIDLGLKGVHRITSVLSTRWRDL